MFPLKRGEGREAPMALAAGWGSGEPRREYGEQAIVLRAATPQGLGRHLRSAFLSTFENSRVFWGGLEEI